jgi:hypothetical protein
MAQDVTRSTSNLLFNWRGHHLSQKGVIKCTGYVYDNTSTWYQLRLQLSVFVARPALSAGSLVDECSVARALRASAQM